MRALGDEALGWIKDGIKPPESAMSVMVNRKAGDKKGPSTAANVPAKISKNKKKKLKKKEKINQLKAANVRQFI